MSRITNKYTVARIDYSWRMQYKGRNVSDLSYQILNLFLISIQSSNKNGIQSFLTFKHSF